MKKRKLRIIGYPILNDPNNVGEVEYFAVDAKTGAYIEGQIDVQITTDENGLRAQVVIDCRDITLLDIMMERQ